MARITMKDLMEAMQKGFNEVKTEVNSLNERVTALETKSVTKVTEKQKPTVSAKGTNKATPKLSGYSTKLEAYEPTIKDGVYKWGKKTDTLKSGNYMACRKAYCYAVATNGQALTSDEVFKKKLTVDFSEEGAYYKAKADFEKKFPYTKKSDR